MCKLVKYKNGNTATFKCEKAKASGVKCDGTEKETRATEGEQIETLIEDDSDLAPGADADADTGSDPGTGDSGSKSFFRRVGDWLNSPIAIE